MMSPHTSIPPLRATRRIFNDGTTCRRDRGELESTSRPFLGRGDSTNSAARQRPSILFLVLIVATSSTVLLGGVHTMVSLDLTPVADIATESLVNPTTEAIHDTPSNTTKARNNTPMVTQTTRENDPEVPEPPKPPMQRNVFFPVVYFQMQNRIPEAHYLWEAICSSLQYDNHVVLVTNARVLKIPAQLRNRFEVFSFNETLEAESNQDLARFLSLYRAGWGYQEPYERICIERFFFLELFMKVRGFGHIFYMDSDATLMSRLAVSDLPHGCEALLPIKASSGPMNFHDYSWSLYIGLGSILSKSVLSDFTPFVSKLYEDSFDVLQEKFDKRPYVTDMTLWYLYAIAASKKFREESAAVPRNFTDRLPETTERQFCDAHIAKFVSNGYRLWQRQRSQTNPGKRRYPRNIHFQGGNKQMMKGLCLQEA